VLLSNINNWRQRHEADCLVACTAMVLDYLGIRRNYDWLTKVLVTTEIGTPFPNLENLEAALGVGIELAVDGTLTTLAPILESGLPIIVAVDSDAPDLWPYYHDHAAVVIGFTTDTVFVNDPAHPQTLEIDLKTFLLAWLNRDYEYAVIRLE
jgi:ABC-type bacteriocin/lantibiotic exporter with double-glycine peptidase domain